MNVKQIENDVSQYTSSYPVDLSLPIEAADNEANLIKSSLPHASTPRGTTPKAKNSKAKKPSASPEAKRSASQSRNNDKKKNTKRSRQRGKAKDKDNDTSSASSAAQPSAADAIEVDDDLDDDDGSDDDYKDSDDGTTKKKRRIRKKGGGRTKRRSNGNQKNRRNDDASSAHSTALASAATGSAGTGGGLSGDPSGLSGGVGGHHGGASSTNGAGSSQGGGAGNRGAGRNRRRPTASAFGQRLMGRRGAREQIPVYSNSADLTTTGMYDDKWWQARAPLVGFPEDVVYDNLKKEIENHKQYDNSDDHLGALGEEHWVEKWMRQDNLPELKPEEKKVLHKNCYDGESAEPRDFYKNLVPPEDRDAVFKHSMTQRLMNAQIDMLHRNQHPFDTDRLKNAPKNPNGFTDENLRPKSMADFAMEVDDDEEWTADKRARDAERAKKLTAEDRTLLELADIGFLDLEVDEDGRPVLKEDDKLLVGKDRTDDEVCIFIRDYCGMLQNSSYELEKLASKLLAKVGPKSNRKKYHDLLGAEEKLFRDIAADEAFYMSPTNNHFSTMKEDIVQAAVTEYRKTVEKTGTFRELTGFKFDPNDYEGPPKNGSENYQSRLKPYPAPDENDSDDESSTPRGAQTPGGSSTPGGTAASPSASSTGSTNAAAQRRKDVAAAARAAALSASRSRSRSLVRGSSSGGGGTGHKGLGSKGPPRRRAQKSLPTGMSRVNTMTTLTNRTQQMGLGGSMLGQQNGLGTGLGARGALGGQHAGINNFPNGQTNPILSAQGQNVALQQQQQQQLLMNQRLQQQQQQLELQRRRQALQQQNLLQQQQQRGLGVGGGAQGSMYGQQGGLGGANGALAGGLGGLQTGQGQQPQFGAAGTGLGGGMLGGGGLGGGGLGTGLQGGASGLGVANGAGGLGALGQTPARPALNRQPSASDDLLQRQLDALAGGTPPLPNQPGPGGGGGGGGIGANFFQ